MPTVPLENAARERVRATRLALSVDSLALLLAGLIAIAVLTGSLPAVPW
jgi:hypothetical protein